MTPPITSTKRQTCVPVKFRLNKTEQKSFNIPIGTKLDIKKPDSQKSYEITANGIVSYDIVGTDTDDERINRQTISANTPIDVIFPQWTALLEFDVNNDGKINYTDVDTVKRYEHTDDGGVTIEEAETSFKIKENLKKTNSQYEVGCNIFDTNIDRGGKFYATFYKKDNSTPYSNGDAGISIFLPKR